MKTYAVKAAASLDWTRADVLRDFCFPWESTPAPSTELRALIHAQRFCFRFDCVDQELVLAEGATEKERVLGSDRVEIFFTPGLELDPYFCLEMDPRGLVYEYQARTYRRFDDTPWGSGLTLNASIDGSRYTVEGSLPLESLRARGVLKAGTSDILAGIYRADFSRLPNGETHFGWMSWVAPATPKPDFHVPSSFGKLRFE